MAEINFYFLTSYTKKILNNYNIFINEKDQSNFFKIENTEYFIYVNKINISKEKAELSDEIRIKIQNEKEENNIYKIKLNLEKYKKTLSVFLFDYNLDNISEEIKVINCDVFNFSVKDEKYMNKNFSTHEYFLSFLFIF